MKLEYWYPKTKTNIRYRLLLVTKLYRVSEFEGIKEQHDFRRLKNILYFV